MTGRGTYWAQFAETITSLQSQSNGRQTFKLIQIYITPIVVVKSITCSVKSTYLIIIILIIRNVKSVKNKNEKEPFIQTICLSISVLTYLQTSKSGMIRWHNPIPISCVVSFVMFPNLRIGY